MTRDFFVRQAKNLEGLLLYAEKALGCITEKETYTLTRDFFVRQVKNLEGLLLYAERALGCITEKDPSKKSKRQRTDTILRSNLYLLRFTLKRLMRPS